MKNSIFPYADFAMHHRIVILAAGSSERLGQPKQLLSFQGSSLIQHTVRAAIEALDMPHLVVTGGYEALVRNELTDTEVEIVYNADWQSGMASSVRTGLRSVMEDSGLQGVVLAVSDQPYVTAGLFSALFRVGQKSPKSIVACRYADGTTGTPVLFKKEMFDKLLLLSGIEGARKIIRNHPDQVETVDFPKGGIDIDTTEDYTNLLMQDRHAE
jgi:molybdenum cofactor cytidylyltransferase